LSQREISGLDRARGFSWCHFSFEEIENESIFNCFYFLFTLKMHSTKTDTGIGIALDPQILKCPNKIKLRGTEMLGNSRK